MKKILSYTSVLAFLLCTGLSCSKGDDSPTYGGGGGGGGTLPTTVNILAMSYSPANVSVKVGTVVKWNNTDAASSHTATSDNGTTFSSGLIPYGGSYSYTTVTTGSFPYHCTVHGVTMAGTLTVTP